ncbi:MAG TPA: BrnA antitoxin family protein [Vicinamibacteria bacterium]|nr:BrnA antitoxin family protein [Vicinamibacteria bacterium]
MKRRKESYDFSKGRRGAVLPVPPGKARITIRIDTDVLDWFRQQVNVAGGGNYQTLMNQALRTHVEQREDGLEEMLRRVLREELQRRRRRSSQ